MLSSLVAKNTVKKVILNVNVLIINWPEYKGEINVGFDGKSLNVVIDGRKILKLILNRMLVYGPVRSGATFLLLTFTRERGKLIIGSHIAEEFFST
jgi:hypothetical protein